MHRPVNKYQEERDERQKMGGVWFTDVRVEVFEEGVDAGREWGHAEKDEECGKAISGLLADCTKEIERLKRHRDYADQVNMLLWVVGRIYQIFGAEAIEEWAKAQEALL